MSAKLKILAPATLTACLVLGGVAALSRAADDPASPAAQDTKPGKSAPPAADASPALSKEMSALRDQLRAVLAAYAQAPLNTRDNTPGEILDACLALGLGAQVFERRLEPENQRHRLSLLELRRRRGQNPHDQPDRDPGPHRLRAPEPAGGAFGDVRFEPPRRRLRECGSVLSKARSPT